MDNFTQKRLLGSRITIPDSGFRNRCSVEHPIFCIMPLRDKMSHLALCTHNEKSRYERIDGFFLLEVFPAFGVSPSRARLYGLLSNRNLYAQWQWILRKKSSSKKCLHNASHYADNSYKRLFIM